MKKRRIFLFGLVFAAVGIVGFFAARFVFQLPDAETQLSVSNRSALVTILNPLQGSRWPADAFIPVGALVISQHKITAAELWADGRLISTKTPAWQDGQMQTTVQWQWMPGKPGGHTLLVRAKTETGETVFSNLVRIDASSPAGFRWVDLSQADENGNPVLVAEMPVEIPEQNESVVVPPPQTLAAPENKPNRLALWLERSFFVPNQRPAAPDLSAATDGCSVHLFVGDNSEDDRGFFLYRALPGSSAFELVDEFGSSPGTGVLQYTDTTAKGPVQYYVSAFNASGEAPSNPIQVTFSDAACLAAEGLTFDGRRLVLPQEVQLAYFYFSVNQQPFNRFPIHPDQFLTPDGKGIELTNFLEALTGYWPQPPQTLDLEVWGWQDDTLVALGRQHIRLDFTDLKICNLGTNCIGDVASTFRSHYGRIASDSPDQQYEFYWMSNAAGTTNALWQIASMPFDGDFHPHPLGLLASGCVEGQTGGSFTVDFAHLEQYSPDQTACVENFHPYFEHIQLGVPSFWKTLPAEEPRMLYARIIPMSGNQPAGRASNTVVIRYTPAETAIEPVVLDHLPNPYHLEITSFSPIKWANPSLWGCVYIKNLDYNAIWESYRKSLASTFTDEQVTLFAQQIYNNLYPHMANHVPVCPPPYKGEDTSWLEEMGKAFWSALKEAWSEITALFNELKNGIVNLVAEVINALGFECNQTCKNGLMTGLEIGMTYFTGIPPSLPTFDELKNAGIDYMIELAASEAGVPCPQECKSVMRSVLNEMFETFEKSQGQPGCVSEDWAKLWGKSPLCFPEGVETEAMPEGLLQPAVVTIKLSNVLPNTPLYQYDNQPAYVVRLKVSEINPHLNGKVLNYYYKYTVKTSGFAGFWSETEQGFFGLSVPITGEISGLPFYSESIPVPALAPGDSVTIPVNLRPTSFDYFIPQHILALFSQLDELGLTIENVEDGWQGGGLNDWECLYKSGQIQITAQVYCLSTPPGIPGQIAPGPDSKLVPCSDEAAVWSAVEPSNPCVP